MVSDAKEILAFLLCLVVDSLETVPGIVTKINIIFVPFASGYMSRRD